MNKLGGRTSQVNGNHACHTGARIQISVGLRLPLIHLLSFFCVGPLFASPLKRKNCFFFYQIERPSCFTSESGLKMVFWRDGAGRLSRDRVRSFDESVFQTFELTELPRRRYFMEAHEWYRGVVITKNKILCAGDLI